MRMPFTASNDGLVLAFQGGIPLWPNSWFMSGWFRFHGMLRAWLLQTLAGNALHNHKKSFALAMVTFSLILTVCICHFSYVVLRCKVRFDICCDQNLSWILCFWKRPSTPYNSEWNIKISAMNLCIYQCSVVIFIFFLHFQLCCRVGASESSIASTS